MLQIEAQFDPPLALTSQPGVNLPTFATWPEFTFWVQERKDFYEPVFKGTDIFELSSLFGPVAPKATASYNDDQRRNAAVNFYSNFKKQLFDLDTREAQFIKKPAETRSPLAARVLLILKGNSQRLQGAMQTADWVPAFAIAELWKYGLLNEFSEDATRLAFQETIKSLEHRSDAFFQVQTPRTEEIQATVDDARGQLEKLRQAIDVCIESSQNSTSEMVQKNKEKTDEFSAEIEKFKERVLRDLSIEAPITYWEDKQRSYRTQSTVWMSAFLVMLVATVGLVAGLWTVTAHANHTAGHAFSYTDFIPCIWLSLLLAWVMRMFSAQFSLTRTLQTGAAERVVLVKTYQSLSYKELLSDESTQLVLATLFRSGIKPPDDIVLPPTLVDVFKNAFSKDH